MFQVNLTNAMFGCIKGLFEGAFNRTMHLLVLCMVLGATACSSISDDPTVNWSPNRLYQEAKDEAAAGRYEKAITFYEKLEARAAGTLLGQQAQLEKAYTFHRNGQQAQALSTIERFLKLHPASPAYDYALYLKGTITFTEDLGLLGRLGGQNLSERDQLAAKDSFQAYRELVNRFPNSKYTADAKQRLVYIVNALAEYEVHVARYYFSRKAYVAAINRAQQAIVDFQDAPALADALAVMVDAYDAMGLVQLRDDTKRILETSFPNRNAARDANKTSRWWKWW